MAPVVDEPDLGPRPNVRDGGDPLPQLVAVLLGQNDYGELRVDRDGEVLQGGDPQITSAPRGSPGVNTNRFGGCNFYL